MEIRARPGRVFLLYSNYSRKEEKTMEKVIDSYNLTVGAVIAVLTAVFGVYWYVFLAYMICNILDWGTGWYKARKLKKESSSVGLKGILKKLGYWVIIAVGFLVPAVFIRLGNELLKIDLVFLELVGWFTLACLLVNEIRSIIENLVECGYNVPQVLIKGLAVADKLINKDSEEEK